MYVNRSDLTTLWKSTSSPDVSTAFLSRLLLDGTTGSRTRDDSSQYVVLDIASLSATLIAVNGEVVDKLSLSKNWSCSDGFGLVGKFDEDAPGEGSVGLRSHSVLTITLAEDSSLVAHVATRFLDGVPSGGRREVWLRFLRHDR
jgi:hypothetical protein